MGLYIYLSGVLMFYLSILCWYLCDRYIFKDYKKSSSESNQEFIEAIFFLSLASWLSVLICILAFIDWMNKYYRTGSR